MSSAVSAFPTVVVTDRLILRPYVRSDVNALMRLVEMNRISLRESFAAMANGLTGADAIMSFIEVKQEEWNGRSRFCYGIWEQRSKTLLGQLQVKNVCWEIPAAEFSYFTTIDYRRQGFAGEAVQGVLDVAFSRLGFRRIALRIVVGNRPSIRLAEKLGFQVEGVHRIEFRCGNGKLHDVCHYAMTCS